MVQRYRNQINKAAMPAAFGRNYVDGVATGVQEVADDDMRAALEAGTCTLADLAARTVGDNVDLSPLSHESELALMRKMDDFTELVELAARDRAPFRLTHYAQDLAALFHQFYTNCHIIGEKEALQHARLALADATRIVLALALGLLGVSVPERM